MTAPGTVVIVALATQHNPPLVAASARSPFALTPNQTPPDDVVDWVPAPATLLALAADDKPQTTVCRTSKQHRFRPPAARVGFDTRPARRADSRDCHGCLTRGRPDGRAQRNHYARLKVNRTPSCGGCLQQPARRQQDTCLGAGNERRGTDRDLIRRSQGPATLRRSAACPDHQSHRRDDARALWTWADQSQDLRP